MRYFGTRQAREAGSSIGRSAVAHVSRQAPKEILPLAQILPPARIAWTASNRSAFSVFHVALNATDRRCWRVTRTPQLGTVRHTPRRGIRYFARLSINFTKLRDECRSES